MAATGRRLSASEILEQRCVAVLSAQCSLPLSALFIPILVTIRCRGLGAPTLNLTDFMNPTHSAPFLYFNIYYLIGVVFLDSSVCAISTKRRPSGRGTSKSSAHGDEHCAHTHEMGKG